MKKIFSVLSIFLIICLLSGCSLFPKKTITDNSNIPSVSQERMEELVIANNAVVDTIYGNINFFSTAELQAHISEFYTQETVEKYFNEKIFYDENGKVLSSISTNNRENISKMQYKIDYNNIFIVNDTQVFDVIFSNQEKEYVLKFTIKYVEASQEWYLTDIVI